MSIDNEERIFLIMEDKADLSTVVYEAWRNELDAEDRIEELNNKAESNEGTSFYYKQATLLKGYAHIEVE